MQAFSLADAVPMLTDATRRRNGAGGADRPRRCCWHAAVTLGRFGESRIPLGCSGMSRPRLAFQWAIDREASISAQD